MSGPSGVARLPPILPPRSCAVDVRRTQPVRLDRLESPEEGQLDLVVLGIGPIRIGGANPVRHQRRSNFLGEIVEHVRIVCGIADVDTLRRSHRPAAERHTHRTSHFTGVGGVDRPVAAADPCLSLIGEIVRRMHHH